MIIAIAEDHPVYASGLSALLKKHLDPCTVHQVTNGQELIALIEKTRVDLVFIDLQMPVMHGLDASRLLSEKYPDLPMIMLSTYYEEKLVEEAMKAGVRGYMTKNTPIEEMMVQIYRAMNGSPGSTSKPPEIPGPENWVREAAHDAPSALSTREQQIIECVRRGYTSQRIASELHMSFNTVQYHRKRILKKLGLKNIQELVAFAIGEGL